LYVLGAALMAKLRTAITSTPWPLQKRLTYV